MEKLKNLKKDAEVVILIMSGRQNSIILKN